MKTHIIIGLLLLLAACTQQPTITNFEECINAGNPAMESYPRQCSANGQTFTEDIGIPIDATACTEPRPTAATREYMPVMGSDENTYNNWRLACMEETVNWYIPQEPSQTEKEYHTCTAEEQAAEICTMDYNPVCGLIDNGIRCITEPCASLDANTYSNGCGACAAQAVQHYQGACEDQTFVVCNGEAKTGFDPTEHAQNIGGICVDICPGNYDPYTTQIGIEVCIKHYDQETIATWQTCDKTANGCNCVKAYETTTNDAIENPQYRCVPDDYAERLIFRGGLDKLDEKGVQSVMIA